MSNRSLSSDTLDKRAAGPTGCRGARVTRLAGCVFLLCASALAGVLLTRADSSPQAAGATITRIQQHPVIVRKPDGVPSVATGKTNFQGQPVVASCSSCHTTTKPNPDLRDSRDLDQFHQGLKYVHGGLTCLSCHNPNNYDTLRMADGRSVEFSDSITLCSQCHGPQRRDYDQGLHGGMRGYWDLSRGGRERNTCVNCHDPHAPAFPAVMPVLPPKDRISVPRDPSHTAANVSH